MVLTRSQENLLSIDEPTNVSFNISLDTENPVQSTQGARSKGRPRVQTSNSRGSGRNDDSFIRQIVTESLNDFRGEITNLITNEIRSVTRNLNIASGANLQNNIVESDNLNRPNITPTNSTDGYLPNTSPRPNSHSPQEPFYAEKVLNIIRNWRLKFSGFDNDMTVDEFIYRVNILTTNNLKGDFELLCKHAHSLFEGKALAWFWRYHRQHDDIDWMTFTNALRKQYKVDYSDFDILDDIRRRKQRQNENFDEYLDIISAMTDKLKIPVSDIDLCETIIRNLKTEIRHELLHLDITSVSQLRKEVRKHEKFMKDLHAIDSRKTAKGRISELKGQDIEDDTLVLTDTEVCGIQHNLKCWNCDKIGHSYMDCLDTKRVFCYGCGVKDTYKPSCPNCSRTKQGNGSRDVRRN